MATDNLPAKTELADGKKDPERAPSPSSPKQKEGQPKTDAASGNKALVPLKASFEENSTDTKAGELPLDNIIAIPPEQTQRKSLWNKFRGIVCIFIATAMIAANAHIIYYVTEVLKSPYSSSNFLFWTYLILSAENLIPLLISVYINCDNVLQPFIDSRILGFVLMIRGFVGSSILFVNWHAIYYFKRPAPVSVIVAMAPIFVYINAFFVLKEKLGFVPIINAVIAISGVFFMNWNGLMHPGEQVEDSNNLLGSALGLLSMYLLSWATVLVRILREVHPFLVNLAFGVCGAALQIPETNLPNRRRLENGNLTILYGYEVRGPRVSHLVIKKSEITVRVRNSTHGVQDKKLPPDWSSSLSDYALGNLNRVGNTILEMGHAQPVTQLYDEMSWESRRLISTTFPQMKCMNRGPYADTEAFQKYLIHQEEYNQIDSFAGGLYSKNIGKCGRLPIASDFFKIVIAQTCSGIFDYWCFKIEHKDYPPGVGLEGFIITFEDLLNYDPDEFIPRESATFDLRSARFVNRNVWQKSRQPSST